MAPILTGVGRNRPMRPEETFGQSPGPWRACRGVYAPLDASPTRFVLKVVETVSSWSKESA
jgi:hypothetical protein